MLHKCCWTKILRLDGLVARLELTLVMGLVREAGPESWVSCGTSGERNQYLSFYSKLVLHV